MFSEWFLYRFFRMIGTALLPPNLAYNSAIAEQFADAYQKMLPP
jgi:hypothetical protein